LAALLGQARPAAGSDVARLDLGTVAQRHWRAAREPGPDQLAAGDVVAGLGPPVAVDAAQERVVEAPAARDHRGARRAGLVARGDRVVGIVAGRLGDRVRAGRDEADVGIAAEIALE